MTRVERLHREIRHHTMVGQPTDRSPTIETLHGHLDVIDTKTSALLNFNAITLAVFSLSLSSSALKGILSYGKYMQFAFVLCAGLIVISTFLCLYSLDIIGAHSGHDGDQDAYIDLAARACVFRTKRFLIARWLTKIGCLFGFALFLVSLYASVT